LHINLKMTSERVKMKFILEASGTFLTDKAKAEIKKAIERALLHYCVITNEDPKKVLLEERWYKRAIRAAISNNNTLNKFEGTG